MSVLRQYQQSSSEVKRYTIGYSNWLDSGENLISVDAQVDPTDVPPFEIVAVHDPVTNIVSIMAGPGGIEGTTYDVSILITTTEGQKKEDCLLFTIIDGCAV